jgi:hypothetical protein
MKTIARNSFITLVMSIPATILFAASTPESLTEDDTYFFHAEERASLEELENARGREGIDITTLNNQNIRGILTDNTATNNTSGLNIIDHGSFAGAGGMFSVIQNSGNNVLIQDSTIINVTIVP